MMILAIVLLRKEWKQGNRNKEKCLKAKKKVKSAVQIAKCKRERKKKTDTLYGGIIRNVMCLRLQRGQPKQIRTLLVSST